PAPQPETLKDAQKIINALWDRSVGFEKNELSMLLKITDLEEKLNTNSTNSSKAPSSDLFKAKKPKKKYHGTGKNKTSKQGGQKGHQGKGRQLLPLEKVDDTVVCLPKSTCECGGHIKANPEKIKRHQQFELPKIKPIVTEYQQIYGACQTCGTTHCGELPNGVSNTLLAPRATATVAIFTGDYRLSKRSTQRVFKDIFNLPVSLGTISNAEKTVSTALESPVEEAKTYIQQYQGSVNADETSHKQQGDKMWVWLAATMLVAVFIIRKFRSADSAKDLLGEKFAGILTTDRYASYNWIKTTCRQFCWAHLKRDMQKISERSGRAGQIGDEILDYIKRMFRLWHRYKNEEINRRTFQTAMKPIREKIERLLTEGTTCRHKKTENSCALMLKHKDSLWTFVDIEGIEPTNNFAEQLIRFYVLWRKSSFGTQSERGNLFVERMMTTTTTCKLQNRNRHDYITAAVAAHLKNEPIPSLLPTKKIVEALKLAA
ncbi:MAG: IS66 family transposase, partial [Methylococcales bacterium]|nr:IS66 family transposase [Methylococcales bacterium]